MVFFQSYGILTARSTPKPIWTSLEEAYIASELDFNKLFN